MAEVRIELGQGAEDEAAPVELGVREDEVRRAHDAVAEEEEVEVEGARPPAGAADAAEGALDAL